MIFSLKICYNLVLVCGVEEERIARAKVSRCESIRHVEGKSKWPGVALGTIYFGEGVAGMK